MSESANRVLDEALRLPVPDRAQIIEQLLSSLDRPDPRMDAVWAKEAEARLAAYDAGEMQAIPAEVVFAEADLL